MPRPLVTLAGRTAQHVPGLRRVPVLKLLALGEIAVLAREHINKLTSAEWRRLIELIRIGRGRPSQLSARERRELESLVAKAQPRLFAGAVVDKLAPVPVPKRLLYGPRSQRRKQR
ncbi:MAG TPA: hypothetical protein VG186_12405 [Solirubrobacteraceae bacterium]|jgi:hypothetical protein|nr:hypothetical protein [Solirubrobacteraceae bacterium]